MRAHGGVFGLGDVGGRAFHLAVDGDQRGLARQKPEARKRLGLLRRQLEQSQRFAVARAMRSLFRAPRARSRCPFLSLIARGAARPDRSRRTPARLRCFRASQPDLSPCRRTAESRSAARPCRAPAAAELGSSAAPSFCSFGFGAKSRMVSSTGIFFFEPYASSSRSRRGSATLICPGRARLRPSAVPGIGASPVRA